MSHAGLFITRFSGELGNVAYEYNKAQALKSHMRQIAGCLSTAASVAKCSKAPERPWVNLHEWTDEYTARRHGQWESDLEIVDLA